MFKKVVIVCSDYYPEIYRNLLEGALNYLEQNEFQQNVHHGAYRIERTGVDKAPGCFEIPFLINEKKDSCDAFIALGCIIRGETYHFELISNEVTRKIMDLSINLKKPIGFGILTCEDLEQAKERSDPNKRNKGAEAAKACIDLLNTIKFDG